jgi:hypothetical protein
VSQGFHCAGKFGKLSLRFFQYLQGSEEMTNWLIKTGDAAKVTWNVIKSVGPYLISQSDNASEAYSRHLARVAAVDAGKELLLQEVRTIGEVRRELLTRFVKADPKERIQIRRDLDESEGLLRKLKVATLALNYIENPKKDADPSSFNGGDEGVSGHWIDRFSELARARNEPWREDLLAKALASESASPGSVSPRALWLLGTLEEIKFNAFSTLLDLASSINGSLMIPQHQAYVQRPIPSCFLGDKIAIGHLTFALGDVGLFGDLLTSKRRVEKGRSTSAYYRGQPIVISCADSDLEVTGIIPSSIGATIASFYEPKTNPLGQEIFDAWIKSLDKTKFQIKAQA